MICRSDHEADVAAILALEAETLLRRAQAAMITPEMRWLGSREVRDWCQRERARMERENGGGDGQ